MPTITDIALNWLDQDIAPVPVVYRHKFPAVPWKRWIDCTPPPLLIRTWFDTHRLNLGLVLNKRLTVLDFDSPAHYVVWREKHKGLAQTYTVKTGRGVHVYFRLNQDSTRRMEGGEIKATGIIIAPPSVHHTGKVYEIMYDLEILTVDSVQDLGVLVEPTPALAQCHPPHFTGSIIERIKTTIPILEYLQRVCKPVQVSGRMWMAVCPFHTDTKPSLAIYPAQQLCYCFAPACRAHRRTDVINCCMYEQNISLKEAVHRLDS